MSLLIVILLIVVMFGLVYATIEWSIHISMVNENITTNGWASYGDFKREFAKYDWVDDYSWGGYSLFNRKMDCKVFASTICFEGKGMIMRSPIDWILVKRSAAKYHKAKYPIQKVNKIKWSSDKM